MEYDRGIVILVERIHTILALALRAVWSAISTIADAAHSAVFVPQLVDVVIVKSGNFLNSLASSVTRANPTSSNWATGSLASRAFISLEAGAGTSGAIANTLSRALAILVSSVSENIAVHIGLRCVQLSGSIWVDEVVYNNLVHVDLSVSVEVSLWNINVGKSKLADSL